jgi:hypothetical protein
MFGFLKKKKNIAQIFTDTLYAVRKHTSIDLDKLTVDEKGSLMELMEKWLEKDQKQMHQLRGRSLSPDELIVFGWKSVLNSGGIVGFRENHTLHGKADELRRGLADFVLPISDKISNYMLVQCGFDEIPDKKSRTGKDISHLI